MYFIKWSKKEGRIILQEISVKVEQTFYWQIQKVRVTTKNTNDKF